MHHRLSFTTGGTCVRWGRPEGRVGATALTLMAIVLLASIVPTASAQSGSRVHVGTIGIGERSENVLPPATETGFSTHAYTVDVPAGVTSLAIAIDSDDADLDLAVHSSGPIDDFSEVDHLDVGPGGNPSYTLSDPPAGRLYIEILNLTRRRVPYSISIRAEGAPVDDAPEAETFPEPVGPDGAAMPSGRYGPLAVDGVIDGAIAAESYHSYYVEVPDGVESLRLSVDGFGADLDLAVNAADPIRDYDDVDYIDVGPILNPTVTIEIVRPVRIYLDVMNFAAEPVGYRLTVDVPEGSAPEGAASDPPAGANPLAPSGSNPLAADRWTGTFEGDGLEVTVRTEGDAYVGTLVLGTQSYPFEAVRRNGRLEGAFFSGGLEFAFVATLDGNVLRVESDGAVYRTERISN